MIAAPPSPLLFSFQKQPPPPPPQKKIFIYIFSKSTSTEIELCSILYLEFWNFEFLEIFSIDCCNQTQPPQMFHKKTVLKNSTIFSRKHLCCSLFSTKLQALTILKTWLHDFCVTFLFHQLSFSKSIQNFLLHVQSLILREMFCVISVDHKI